MLASTWEKTPSSLGLRAAVVPGYIVGHSLADIFPGSEVWLDVLGLKWETAVGNAALQVALAPGYTVDRI